MPRLHLPRVYPLTDLKVSGEKSHTALVRKLHSVGFGFVQLRGKTDDANALFLDYEKACAFAQKKKMKLILNDRVDFCMALNAAGVHLGQDDLPVSDARKLLGKSKIIGVSTHSVRQALKAAREGVADYIAIGPIYKTATKRSGRKNLGPETVYRIRKLSNIPIVAIGGITARTAPELWEAGADSVAVVAGLMRGDLKKNVNAFKVAAEKT